MNQIEITIRRLDHHDVTVTYPTNLSPAETLRSIADDIEWVLATADRSDPIASPDTPR